MRIQIHDLYLRMIHTQGLEPIVKIPILEPETLENIVTGTELNPFF